MDGQYSKSIDYSYLVLKNAEKVHDFIEKYGIFITNARQFWETYKKAFEKFPKAKQEELFNALCEIEKECLSLLYEDFN